MMQQKLCLENCDIRYNITNLATGCIPDIIQTRIFSIFFCQSYKESSHQQESQYTEQQLIHS